MTRTPLSAMASARRRRTSLRDVGTALALGGGGNASLGHRHAEPDAPPDGLTAAGERAR